MRRYLILIMLVISALSWAGEDVMVLCKDLSFIVHTPKGWIADIHSGASQGANVVVYPKGSTWQNAQTVVYARVEKKGKRSLDQLVTSDVKQFQGDCPSIRIEVGSLPFKSLYPSQLRKFICTDESAPNSEVVVYLDVGKSFIIWVASSRKESEINAIRPILDQIVKDLVVMNVTREQ